MPEDPLREEVRAFNRDLALGVVGRARDRNPRFPDEEFRALGAAGLLGLTVPAALGGRGFPAARAATALFELAYRGGTMPAKLSLQPEFCTLLAIAGSEELRARYYAPLLRGELLVANQITEPNAGSDVGAIESTAVRRGDAYFLTGTKSQAAFAVDAHAAIVYARTGGAKEGRKGISAFLVPQDAAGIRRTTFPDYGERWMRRGTVQYEEVLVPEAHRLGPEGAALDLLRTELTHERALLGAIYLGVAWASWEETVRFVGDREAFGKPLADQQAVAFPLVEDRARLTAAWLLVERCLRRLDARETVDEDAALAKWYAGQVALETVDHALQFHGGAGYSEELPHAQRYRDLRSARVAHGTDEIMHLVAARGLWPARRGPPSKD